MANSSYMLAGPHVDFDGVDPALRGRLISMLDEYKAVTGNTAIINSGRRTPEYQTELQKTNPYAVDPSRSPHVVGGIAKAVDVSSVDMETAAKLGLLEKYGLHRPVSGEPWHVALKDGSKLVESNLPLAQTTLPKLSDEELLDTAPTPQRRLSLANKLPELSDEQLMAGIDTSSPVGEFAKDTAAHAIGLPIAVGQLATGVVSFPASGVGMLAGAAKELLGGMSPPPEGYMGEFGEIVPNAKYNARRGTYAEQQEKIDRVLKGADEGGQWVGNKIDEYSGAKGLRESTDPMVQRVQRATEDYLKPAEKLIGLPAELTREAFGSLADAGVPPSILATIGTPTELALYSMLFGLGHKVGARVKAPFEASAKTQPGGRIDPSKWPTATKQEIETAQRIMEQVQKEASLTQRYVDEVRAGTIEPTDADFIDNLGYKIGSRGQYIYDGGGTNFPTEVSALQAKATLAQQAGLPTTIEKVGNEWRVKLQLTPEQQATILEQNKVLNQEDLPGALGQMGKFSKLIAEEWRARADAEAAKKSKEVEHAKAESFQLQEDIKAARPNYDELQRQREQATEIAPVESVRSPEQIQRQAENRDLAAQRQQEVREARIAKQAQEMDALQTEIATAQAEARKLSEQSDLRGQSIELERARVKVQNLEDRFREVGEARTRDILEEMKSSRHRRNVREAELARTKEESQALGTQAVDAAKLAEQEAQQQLTARQSARESQSKTVRERLAERQAEERQRLEEKKRLAEENRLRAEEAKRLEQEEIRQGLEQAKRQSELSQRRAQRAENATVENLPDSNILGDAILGEDGLTLYDAKTRRPWSSRKRAEEVQAKLALEGIVTELSGKLGRWTLKHKAGEPTTLKNLTKEESVSTPTVEPSTLKNLTETAKVETPVSSKPVDSSRTKTFEEPGLTRTYELRKDGHVYTRNTEMSEGKWQPLTKGLSDSARQRLIERIFDKGENYLGEEPPTVVESAKPEIVAPEKKPRESSQPLIEPRKKVEEVAKDLGIEGVDWSQQEVEVTPAEVRAIEAVNPTIAKGEYKGLSRKEAIAKAAEKRRQALAKAEPDLEYKVDNDPDFWERKLAEEDAARLESSEDIMDRVRREDDFAPEESAYRDDDAPVATRRRRYDPNTFYSGIDPRLAVDLIRDIIGGTEKMLRSDFMKRIKKIGLEELDLLAFGLKKGDFLSPVVNTQEISKKLRVDGKSLWNGVTAKDMREAINSSNPQFDKIAQDAILHDVPVYERAQQRGLSPQEAHLLAVKFNQREGSSLYGETGESGVVKQVVENGRKKPKVTKDEWEQLSAGPDIEKPGRFATMVQPFEEGGSGVTGLIYDRARPLIKNAELKYKELSGEMGDAIKKLGSPFRRFKSADKVVNNMIGERESGLNRLKEMGIEHITADKLTPAEQQFKSELRAWFDKIHPLVNEARVRAGLSPLKYEDRYITFLHEGDMLSQLGAKQIHPIGEKPAPDYVHSAPFRFAKVRGNLPLPVNMSAAKIIDVYARASAKHIHLAEFTAWLQEATGTFHHPEINDGKPWNFAKAKPHTYDMVQEWIDEINGVKIKPDLISPRIDKTLRKLGEHLSVAVLANPLTYLRQFSSYANTFIELGPKASLDGLAALTDPKMRAFAEKESNHLAIAKMDSNLQELGKLYSGRPLEMADAVMRKGRQSGYYFLQLFDHEMRVATWNAAYKQQIPFMDHKSAVNFADRTVIKTQGSGNVADISPFQRTNFGRIAALWQTFTIANWNFLTKDVLGYKNPNMLPKDIGYKVAKLVVAWQTINTVCNLAGIRSPFPDPFAAAQEAKKKGYGIAETVGKIGLEAMEIVPMLGGNLKYGSTTAGPLIQFVDQLIALPSAMVTKDRKPRESYVEFLNRTISETTKGRQDLPSMVGSLAGVPGSRYAKTVSTIRERGGGWDDALLGRYPEKRKGTLRTRATRDGGRGQRATR